MADKKTKYEWPPRRSRFIGGVLYTVDQLLELGPDFAPAAVAGVAAKSTPIGSMTDAELAAVLERRKRGSGDGEKKPPALDDPEKMTEAALKAELAEANVEFDGRLGHEKLVALVVEHRAKK